ncbi:MAG TPA: hypothetical protein VNN10_11125 [Dehalococcoidia bacterium]|nr:hypothetical protein [Dehalococcoidia bacterium]
MAMVDTRLTKDDLLARIRKRGPLTDPVMPGYSGSPLERAVLDDGTAVVIKHIDLGRDLAAIASNDRGRAATLWLSGLLDRLPRSIDHATMAAWPEEGGWTLVMRDVSAALIEESRVLTRDESRRVLRQVADYHRTLAGVQHQDLCPLETHLSMFSPRSIARLDQEAEIIIAIKVGWRAFERLAPAAIREAVLRLQSDPRPLAEALRSRGTTLVHGDLWFSNLGLLEDGLVILDWSLATAAPGALDFALFLLGNSAAIDATRDEIVRDYQAVCGDAFDRAALDLGLLGAFVEYGWLLANGEEHGWDEGALAWWLDAISPALGRLPAA